MNAILFLYSAGILASVEPPTTAAGPDCRVVAAALKHHEGMIKTLQVDYEYTMLPTSAEQAALLRRVLGKKAEAAISTPDFAKRNSGTARFWRKGAKQRDEWTPLDPGQPQGKRRAFDGQVLRNVRDHWPDGRPSVAAIASGQTGDWYSMPRDDPMAFLYLFYERPFSDVVASASAFSSAVVMRGQERLYRVSVDCAPPSVHRLEFLFNERFLQLERVVKVWLDQKRDRLVHNHKLVFSGYRAYDTPSGESIWFPEAVTYTGYSMEGAAPDGSPLEGLWKEFRFTKVEFNIDMPDSLFELEIPKDARINDLLTGAGWLDQGKRPEALFPAEARARRLWVGAVVIAALVVVTAAVFYKRRRRPSATV